MTTLLTRSLVFLLCSSALLAEQGVVLGLSANGVSAPAVYPGGPLILYARLFSASDEPVLLEVNGGAWTAALSLRIAGPDGSSPEWNFKLVAPPELKVTLDEKQSVQLFWLLSPEDAAKVGEGPFEIALAADTTKLAAPGAWIGQETSNFVRVSFQPEPDEWIPELLNQHWLNQSLYHQLNGQSTASLQAVETLLEKYPESLPGWIRKGDIHASSDQHAEAIAAFAKALDIFRLQNPGATHPPSEILNKLNDAHLKKMSVPPQ